MQSVTGGARRRPRIDQSQKMTAAAIQVFRSPVGLMMQGFRASVRRPFRFDRCTVQGTFSRLAPIWRKSTTSGRGTQDLQLASRLDHHSASCEGWTWAAHVVKLGSVSWSYEITNCGYPVSY
jgi:hypothetical protein